MKKNIFVLSLLIFSMIALAHSMDNKQETIDIIRFLLQNKNPNSKIFLHRSLFDEENESNKSFYLKNAKHTIDISSKNIFYSGLGTLFIFTTFIALRCKSFLKHGI